jgi:hypothetical protein
MGCPPVGAHKGGEMESVPAGLHCLHGSHIYWVALEPAGLLCHHISDARRFWGGSSQEAVRSAKVMNSPKMTMKSTRMK